MISIHETIASDQHWSGPVQQEPQRAPLLARLTDVALAHESMAAIDDIYRSLGTSRTTYELPTGHPLGLSGSGLLKVVEDMRTRPVGTAELVSWRSPDTPEVFDQRAQQMTDVMFFDGASTSARIEGQNGVMEVVRRVMYLINAPSGKQLVGKGGHMLGRGGNLIDLVTMRPYHVGHIRQRETDRAIVQTRVVSAEIIAPIGIRKVHARQRVFPPRLLPQQTSPAGAF